MVLETVMVGVIANVGCQLHYIWGQQKSELLHMPVKSAFDWIEEGRPILSLDHIFEWQPT